MLLLTGVEMRKKATMAAAATAMFLIHDTLMLMVRSLYAVSSSSASAAGSINEVGRAGVGLRSSSSRGVSATGALSFCLGVASSLSMTKASSP